MISKYVFLEQMAPGLRALDVQDRKHLVDDARRKTFSKSSLFSLVTIVLVPGLVFLALTVLPIVLMYFFSVRYTNYYSLGFIFLSVIVINFTNDWLLAIFSLPDVKSILDGRETQDLSSRIGELNSEAQAPKR